MQLRRTVCQTEVAAEQFSRKGGNSLPIPPTKLPDRRRPSLPRPPTADVTGVHFRGLFSDTLYEVARIQFEALTPPHQSDVMAE